VRIIEVSRQVPWLGILAVDNFATKALDKVTDDKHVNATARNGVESRQRASLKSYIAITHYIEPNITAEQSKSPF
jgi:hypothetical protein